MWAMVVKEFRELVRDRRTMAMLIALPLILLIVFGYAANFSVSSIDTEVVGPQAAQVAAQAKVPFHVQRIATPPPRVPTPSTTCATTGSTSRSSPARTVHRSPWSTARRCSPRKAPSARSAMRAA
jgi:hypothetical protein